MPWGVTGLAQSPLPGETVIFCGVVWCGGGRGGGSHVVANQTSSMTTGDGSAVDQKDRS